MDALADLLESQAGELAQRWSARPLPLPRDLPGLLRVLAGALRAADAAPPSSAEPASAALSTGDPASRVRAYARLRSLLLEWLEAQRIPVRLSQVSALTASLDAALERELSEHGPPMRASKASAELEAIFASMVDAVYVGTRDGITRANGPALEQLGYDSIEALNRNIGTLAREIQTRRADTGEPISMAEQAFSHALSGERDVQEVLIRHRKTGEDRVVRAACGPIVMDGHVVGAVAINTDITQAQRAKDALSRTERELRELAESMPQSVWIATPDGDITYVNQVMELFTGRPRELLLGRHWEDLIHPDDQVRSWEHWKRALDTGSFYEVEHRSRRHDGTYRWFLARGRPLKDERGRVLKWLGTSTDIHDMKLAQEEARRRAGFEQQLIGIVSHDLRNPISAILLAATALTRHTEALDERTLKGLLRIQAIAERATRMVRDLLDFTQARLGGGLGMRKAELDLAVLARQVVDEVKATHVDRDVHLDIRGETRGAWDADRLAQALINLITNALRHGSSTAPVTVTVRGDARAVSVGIHNQGPPIPAEHVSRLFQPFQRGAPDADAAGRSVGLGLYIVDQIVRAHGGAVEVHSARETGTTFTLRLPRDRG
ncbi:PAS domain-containing sensor histidine kinase [Corallococcus sp. M34]|uniref:sensor histidine kinase n=1 Tax=Citreicoccus inhibens TaxID=2849499 RepID=UPI001C23427E|nr:PAS domain-containing sensor histidine kinase [Citreicoccus inhibens]MBU8900510.1 PAS domain-containing sensor histidine kinase [Citreicoccus inhibens]